MAQRDRVVLADRQPGGDLVERRRGAGRLQWWGGVGRLGERRRGDARGRRGASGRPEQAEPDDQGASAPEKLASGDRAGRACAVHTHAIASAAACTARTIRRWVPQRQRLSSSASLIWSVVGLGLV